MCGILFYIINVSELHKKNLGINNCSWYMLENNLKTKNFIVVNSKQLVIK